jgi:acetylornithine/succinyldiaminopimelate/putrescine aminotransferase
VNSGTEANESAVHIARKLTGRETVVTLTESFHGRTLASLSLTGLEGYRRKVPLNVPDHWLRTIALGQDDLDAIDGSVAAVMIESVVSLGGVYLPQPGWLARVEARCREVGALLILDEVQGGVGRLGTWFAHETLGCTPDLVTLAKSLGGGFPVGATVVTKALGDQLKGGDLGTTFGGGPMACAMVETVAKIVRRDGLMDRVLAIEARVRAGLADVAGVQVRGRGALLGVETSRPAAEVQARLLDHDILVGTSSHPRTLRLLPSYTVSDAEIDRFVGVFRQVAVGRGEMAVGQGEVARG